MINKVTLIGNLGKDPEKRILSGDAIVTSFSIATTENYRDKSGEWQKKTEWHDIVFWGKNAENAERVLSKGSQVYLEGKLTHRTYEAKDGTKRYATEVVGQMFRKLNKAESNQPDATQGSADHHKPASELPAEAIQESVLNGDDDDLPF